MVSISPKRKRVLDFISGFIKEKGYAPSMRDIAKGCALSSSSVAQYYVKALEREGYIHRDPEVSRSIGLIEKQPTTTVPVLGAIAAGRPIPVPSPDTWVTIPEEMIDLPAYLAGGLTNLYALRVKGKSMIDQLIDDGDIVVMRSADTAEDGQTVAVWLKDRQEVTLKKVYREADRIRLQPANSLMEPIYAKPENVQIQGSVVAVLRKLSG